MASDSRRRLIDLGFAREHLNWVFDRQGPGFAKLHFFIETADGNRLPREVYWAHNRSPDLGIEIQTVFESVPIELRHCFYTVNSFRTESARAENVVPSRLVHVDGDGVMRPPPGPSPSRIVQTSAKNCQLLYELDAPAEPPDLQAISRALTRITCGDKGGHSPAKLLRLPGTLNIKSEYKEPFRVKVVA